MTTVCVFPGQGSQKQGMGSDLFPRFPEQVSIANEALGYSIEQLCLEDPEGNLGRTDFTQPALYVVNALSFFARQADGDPEPAFLAGHSLGEYNALLAAGAFDFATGLGIVQRRGQLMAEASGGGMVAVVGLSPDQVREVLESAPKSENENRAVDMANLNSPTQVVLSGPVERLRELREPFEAAGCRMFRELDVSAPFHSRYMAPAQSALSQFLDSVEMSAPCIPVIANVTARPYGDDVRQLLASQVTAPVRWTESIQYLLELGLPDLEIEEIGPGKVLTGLVRKIRQASGS